MTDWTALDSVLVAIVVIPIGLLVLWVTGKLRDRLNARYEREQMRLAELAAAQVVYDRHLRGGSLTTDDWERARRTS